MLNRLMLCGWGVGAATLAWGAPAVSITSVSQDAASRAVKIAYALAGGPAIITCDVCTNGVSVGGAALQHFSGDVNRKLADGAHAAVWYAPKDLSSVMLSASSVSVRLRAWAPNTPPDYMVVDLVSGAVRYYPSAEALPDGPVTNDIYKTERMAFRRIPSKNVEFRMGTNESENWGLKNESARLVTLTNDYYLAVYPLTQRQWYNVMGTMPDCNYTADDRGVHPVEKFNAHENRGEVHWNVNGTVNHSVGSSGFLAALRTRVGGGAFDYPLEALWEFACRAGCGNNLYENDFGYADLEQWENSERLKRLGAHRTGQTMPVGLYPPNRWGLYDMLGNVEEFCLDEYAEDLTGVDANAGPIGSSGQLVTRGGAFSDEAVKCRTAARVAQWAPGWLHIGVRIACSCDALP